MPVAECCRLGGDFEPPFEIVAGRTAVGIVDCFGCASSDFAVRTKRFVVHGVAFVYFAAMK